MSGSSVLRLPYALCRDLAVLGGSALALKVALLLLAADPLDSHEAVPVTAPDDEDGHEHEASVDGEPVAYAPAEEPVPPLLRVSMSDVVTATGASPGNVRRAFEVIERMMVSWPDPDDDEAYVTLPLFVGVGTGPRAAWGQAAVYGTVTSEVADMIGTGREVEVPVADLLALRTRSAVLLLVRGLAALSVYGGVNTSRSLTGSRDLGIYTGVPTSRETGGWDQIEAYLVPGAEELDRRGASLSARVLVDRAHVHDPRGHLRPRAEPRRQRRAAVGRVDVVWTRRVPLETVTLPDGVDLDAA